MWRTCANLFFYAPPREKAIMVVKAGPLKIAKKLPLSFYDPFLLPRTRFPQMAQMRHSLFQFGAKACYSSHSFSVRINGESSTDR